jgi:hypothetical protein
VHRVGTHDKDTLLCVLFSTHDKQFWPTGPNNTSVGLPPTPTPLYRRHPLPTLVYCRLLLLGAAPPLGRRRHPTPSSVLPDTTASTPPSSPALLSSSPPSRHRGLLPSLLFLRSSSMPSYLAPFVATPPFSPSDQTVHGAPTGPSSASPPLPLCSSFTGNEE